MNSNKSTFVLIVTYNGSRWIERCLSSLTASTVPVQILVIDNASTDNTVELIVEKFLEVELIRSKENLGFGRANNIGLKMALEQKADYVFLLNQDAWVDANTIEGLIQVAKHHPEYGILSPFHLNYEGISVETYFDEWVLSHYTPGYRHDEAAGTLREVYPSSFVHAACWLMPISTVKDVGGFDPLFFHYDEDVDFAIRTQFKGKLIGVIPNLRVHHNGTNLALTDSTNNFNLVINKSVLQLKNLNSTLVGAIALFFKQFLRIVLSQANNKTQKRAYYKNLKRIFPILKSREIQKESLAYLK